MSYKRGWMKKFINNVSTKVFAFAHVKTVYKDYENGITLDDVLVETEDYDQSAVTESEISPVILSKINEVATQSASNFTLLNANKAESAKTYTKSEVDNLISALKQECDWKESVETFADLSTTYPDAEKGWTVTVKDTNTIYRFNGTEWVDIYSLINLATASNDGLMSKSDYSKLSGIEAGANKYVHPGSGTNPHGTTKSDVGLGNVDNTSDMDKPVSTAQQEKFTELNSNLSQLSYSDVAGGKNIVFGVSYGHINSSGYYFIDNKSTSAICYLENGKTYKISCNIKPFADNIRIGKIYSKTPENGTVDNLQQLGKGIDTFTSNFTGYAIVYTHPSKNENVINSIQIEEGTQATEYEPYIPSVKMLVEENAQQNTETMDLKMLGWVVPEEMPIKNYVDSDGVFHQRVGRVDLGSLDWVYVKYAKSMYTSNSIGLKPITKNIISTNGYIGTDDNNPTNWNDKIIFANDSYIYIKDLSYTDANTFKQALKGVYLYYELATPITYTIDGNEALTNVNESLGVIGKCKNLLNPTLATTTKNGVTCTDNGDGTYTLNGTANDRAIFYIFDNSAVNFEAGTYNFILCKNISEIEDICSTGINFDKKGWVSDLLNDTVTLSDNDTLRQIWIDIKSGKSVNNLVIKPMITTDLNASYDDFVPYTGDGETLTHDVAEIKQDLTNNYLTKEIANNTYATTGQISGLNNNITNLGTQLNVLGQNVGQLSGQVSGLSEECSNVKSSVDALKNYTVNKKAIGEINGCVLYRQVWTGIVSAVADEIINHEIGSETWGADGYITKISAYGFKQTNGVVSIKDFTNSLTFSMDTVTIHNTDEIQYNYTLIIEYALSE